MTSMVNIFCRKKVKRGVWFIQGHINHTMEIYKKIARFLGISSISILISPNSSLSLPYFQTYKKDIIRFSVTWFHKYTPSLLNMNVKLEKQQIAIMKTIKNIKVASSLPLARGGRGRGWTQQAIWRRWTESNKSRI